MDRSIFYSSLNRMLLLSDEALLVDKFPPSDPHNIGTRILRLGLSVTAFASLERYMEGCFERAFTALSTCRFDYGQFPSDLREFLTISAVAGLATRGAFVPEPDRLLYFETHIPALAKYGQIPPTYTAFGFSPKGSNVNAADVGTALKALTVKKPWPLLASISAAAGSSSVNIFDDYQNLARTRHRSAHNPQFNLPTSDLKTNIRTAIAIGIAVDILTKVVSNVWTSAPTINAVSANLLSMTFPMRFLDDELVGTVVERATANGGVLKRYTDQAIALSRAGGRATKAFVIRRDASGLPRGLAAETIGSAAL